MRLILTRHGETEENVKSIIQGHLPGKLTKKGREQAKKLAKRLAKEKIDVIYSSDLARTVDTTKEIVKYHPKIPVHYIQELRERKLGILEGQHKSAFSRYRNVKNIERMADLLIRAKKLIQDIYKKNKRKNVLLVSHGCFGHALVCAIKDKSHRYIRPNELSNTSVSIFDIKENQQHRIILYNSVGHLQL
jgi:broad specificity phosphatase PhoE